MHTGWGPEDGSGYSDAFDALAEGEVEGLGLYVLQEAPEGVAGVEEGCCFEDVYRIG